MKKITPVVVLFFVFAAGISFFNFSRAEEATTTDQLAGSDISSSTDSVSDTGTSTDNLATSTLPVEAFTSLPSLMPTSLGIIPTTATTSESVGKFSKVQLLDQFGELIDAPTGGVHLNLLTDSETGLFTSGTISTETCNESGWSAGSLNLTIASGTAQRGFCYKDATIGTSTIIASSTDVFLASANQVVVIISSSSSGATTTPDIIAPQLSIDSAVSSTGTINITGATDDASSSIEVTAASSTLVASLTGTSTWSAGPFILPIGTHEVLASSTDQAGNRGSATGTITVAVSTDPEDSFPPVVEIISPVNYALVRGVVGITASSSDDSGEIDKIEFYAGVGASSDRIGESTSSISWDTSAVSDNVYSLWAKAYDLAGNSATSSLIYVQVDNTKPVITLNGEKELTIAVGSDYIDADASAIDNVDGDITHRVEVNNPVDTLTVGDYTVAYNVTDVAGNAADQATRLVRVRDLIAPIISLNGSSTATIYAGDLYLDPGATASDNYDEFVPVEATSTVNALTPGTYSVTFTASDSSGNEALPVVRKVTVLAKPGAVVEDISTSTPTSTPDVSPDEIPRVGGQAIQAVNLIGNNGQGQVLGASTVRFSRLLHRGMRGLDILELTRRLKSEDVHQGIINSYFSNSVKLAVKNYQKNHKLPITGLVDMRTRDELNGKTFLGKKI